MANNVNPDETAHNEPSHLDLHCLQKHLSLLRGLMVNWHTLLRTFVVRLDIAEYIKEKIRLRSLFTQFVNGIKDHFQGFTRTPLD